MSIEGGNNKAISDLGVSFKFHNHSTGLKNDKGAGVNATTSKGGSTLVTSRHLSELVWCPRKGISVKNADRDRSLTKKEAAVLRELRQNNMAGSSAKSISTKWNSSSKIFVDDKFDTSSPCHVKFGVDKVNASRRASRSMVMETGGLVHGQNEGSSPSVGVGNSEGLIAIPGNASSIAIRSREGPSPLCNVSTAFGDREGKSLLNTPGAIARTLDRLDFSAENDVVDEASVDVNTEAFQHEGLLVNRNIHAENNLPNKRKEACLRKGKGKALSDGDINYEIAGDAVSHGSAGSCNSKLASSRNMKRSLGQQLMVTSKRLKQSTERDVRSETFIRQSSSFMSWITNMVKGYPGSNHDDAPSSMLAGMLTTHDEQENRHEKPVGRELRCAGFRNLFQSICCSNRSVEGRKIYMGYRSSEASGDVKNSSMVDASAAPLTVYKTCDNIPEDSCQSSKVYDQPKSSNLMGSPSNQGIIHLSNFSTKEIKILPENTISCNVASGADMVKSSQYISSTDSERALINEYKHEKEARPIGQKSDYLGSLWITRFRPKFSQPVSNMVTSKLTISKRVVPDSEKIISRGKGVMDEVLGEHLPEYPMTSHSKGCNGFVKHEGFVGLEQVNVEDEKNLEVMASVFARRLDALKQVVPFDAACTPSLISPTCFFCGASGHDIQSCAEISESNLEELSHAIKSYDKFKESACLCIRCFQFSHWAIECPQQTSRKYDMGSFVDWSNDINLRSFRRDKEQKLLQDRSIGTPAPTSGNLKPDTESFQVQDCSKLNQEIANIRNPLNSISGGREVSEPSSPPQNKITAAMEDFFEAVRRLRLSRSNFIRLVESQISPSHLRGFYIRVRLANWRQGSGRKGYYVACINDTSTATARNQGALDQAGLKTSVGITIGSFTCFVESQYISNQDFLEDELATWWMETGKCGDIQHPSLEELEQKYKERQSLGL